MEATGSFRTLVPVVAGCHISEDHNLNLCCQENTKSPWQFYYLSCIILDVHSGAVGWGTVLQAGRLWVQLPMGLFGFFIDLILPAAWWLWGRLSLSRKWIPGVSREGEGRQPVHRADNCATFMCWLSRNSSSLNLLELWGPVQGFY
jgi:hypothetical protein